MDEEDKRERKVGGAVFVLIGVAGVGSTAYEILWSAFLQETPIQFYRLGLQFQGWEAATMLAALFILCLLLLVAGIREMWRK